MMPIRRTLKNVVKNYSEAQIKVREATSNDAWGPSTTLMSEIADLTYNVVAYAEIMPILWRRLEDTGRNWRHVYKSLVLLDYLVRNGSERVARECRERAWAIKAIADSFDFAEGADSTGQDRGAGVRERARALTALLRDDDRLRNERAKALKARERFAQNSSSVSGANVSGTTVTGASVSGLSTNAKYSLRSISPLHSSSMFSESAVAGGYSEFGSPSLSSLEASQYGIEGGTGAALESEFEALRPTSSGEEELQLQLALAMSKEEHEEELRRLKGDEAKLQMAIDESRKQAVIPSPSHVRGDGSVQPASENADLLSSLKDSAEPFDQWALPPPSASTTEHRFKSSSPAVLSDTRLTNNPPILPPPPSKVMHQQQTVTPVAVSVPQTVCTDPWLSTTSDVNMGAWGMQQPQQQHAMTSSLLAASSSSARSSPWESPSHSFPNSSFTTAVAFDDEFDVIGTRSKSPVVQGVPPVIPPRRPLTGSEGDPWDFSNVNQSLKHEDLTSTSIYSSSAFQSSSHHSTSFEPQMANQKSAHNFLGDNANLVNLDNLFSRPSSGAANPFSSASRSSSPAVAAATNPFGTPPSVPARQFSNSSTAASAAPSSVMPDLFAFSSPPAPVVVASTGGTGFISQDLSSTAGSPFVVGQPATMMAYPQAYNPFL